MKRHGVPFLMPAVKGNNIKKALAAFSEGDIPAVSTFTMTSGDKKISADVTLVITKRPKKKHDMSEENKKLMDLYNKKTKEYDEYIPFITNMRFPNLEDDPEQVAEFYRRRWGVEVSYKGYEQIRPWTTSTSYSVRILLLFFPFVVYNAWILADHLAKRKNNSNDTSSDKHAKYVRPVCPLGLFVGILHDILNQYALESERHKGPPDIHPYGTVAA